jgi:hypothetical protein
MSDDSDDADRTRDVLSYEPIVVPKQRWRRLAWIMLFDVPMALLILAVIAAILSPMFGKPVDVSNRDIW